MRRATGRGGELFLAGDPVRWRISLRDCGDGFDWQAASYDKSFWVAESGTAFQVYEQDTWTDVMPLETHYPTGRVAFARSLQGRGVSAEVVVRPLSPIAASERWEMSFRLPALSAAILGGPVAQKAAEPMEAAATLYGDPVHDMFEGTMQENELLVRLPFAEGLFWGFGKATDRQGVTQFTFNEGGVTYDLA